MKHSRGDCPKADPNSDELCEFCHKCERIDCVRPIDHIGPHGTQEEYEEAKEYLATTTEKEWDERFAEMYTKLPVMLSLDELHQIKDFIREIRKEAYEEGKSRVVGYVNDWRAKQGTYNSHGQLTLVLEEARRLPE